MDAESCISLANGGNNKAITFKKSFDLIRDFMGCLFEIIFHLYFNRLLHLLFAIYVEQQKSLLRSPKIEFNSNRILRGGCD